MGGEENSGWPQNIRQKERKKKKKRRGGRGGGGGSTEMFVIGLSTSGIDSSRWRSFFLFQQSEKKDPQKTRCCRYVFIVSPFNCFRMKIKSRQKNSSHLRIKLVELL